jgi:predicted permease
MSLVDTFATAILPIVAVASAGVALGRLHDLDVGPLNTVTLYVLVPALVFHSVATATLDGATLVRIGVATLAYFAVMLGVSEAVGRLLGETEPTLSALVLVSAFPNSGNYGIPLSEFAFGATGRSTAVLFLTVQALVTYTVGVYVAARGGGSAGLAGMRRVLRVPLVYAVVAAVAARWLGVVPPADGTAMRTVGLVGEASIPLMLLILGVYLARTDHGAVLARAGSAVVLKTLVAPVVGVGVALAVGFADPTVARTFVLECATPAAVTSLLLVVEFGDEGDGELSVGQYVSTVVLVTTLASVPLLTVLVAALEAGLLV